MAIYQDPTVRRDYPSNRGRSTRQDAEQLKSDPGSVPHWKKAPGRISNYMVL